MKEQVKFAHPDSLLECVGKKQERQIALETFLRKLYARLQPSILEDNTQTRLDSDLEDELEKLLGK